MNLDNIVNMRTGSGEERESALQSGWTVEANPKIVEPVAPEPVIEVVDDTTDAAGADADTGRPAQMSSLTVVLLGLSGGLFLLYAWVWMSWAQYYADVNAAVFAGRGSIGGMLQQIVFWIAPLAPIFWFLSALALTRNRTRRLVCALVLGLIVTFPLPMVFLSGAAL
ncbi:hypothetical protein [Leucobacter sp. G161]|uniref:hypothetical protein n=1 Tax=Leucobacter sp. G161 TaxID=663704 RepID=UPI000AA3BE0D|nr:hypothetical protein [Leucobacter sp. G161]